MREASRLLFVCISCITRVVITFFCVLCILVHVRHGIVYKDWVTTPFEGGGLNNPWFSIRVEPHTFLRLSRYRSVRAVFAGC